MDYMNMKNIESDTKMRTSISDTSEDGNGKQNEN